MSHRPLNCVGAGLSQCRRLSTRADKVLLRSIHITQQVRHWSRAERWFSFHFIISQAEFGSYITRHCSENETSPPIDYLKLNNWLNFRSCTSFLYNSQQFQVLIYSWVHIYLNIDTVFIIWTWNETIKMCFKCKTNPEIERDRKKVWPNQLFGELSNTKRPGRPRKTTVVDDRRRKTLSQQLARSRTRSRR